MIVPISLALPQLELEMHTPLNLQFFDFQEESAFVKTHSLNTGIHSVETNEQIAYLFGAIYFLGVFMGLSRLVLYVFKLYQTLTFARKLHPENPSILFADVPLVFSCFKWIFLPRDFQSNQLDTLLLHEKAHLRLGHSYDLLLLELFVTFNWFNPFAYLFRHLLKTVHEFQADEAVLKKGVKKSDYLQLMLENTLQAYPQIFSSAFSNACLKNRVEMISKHKDQGIQRGKYLLILPFLFVLCLLIGTISLSKPIIFPIDKHFSNGIVAPFVPEKEAHLLPQQKKHLGIDIIAPKSSPVKATAKGKILYAESSGDWGNLVIIDHGDGYQSRYAHLQDILVQKDQQVEGEEIIGHVGNTGMAAKAHLHYEVLKNGKHIDPAKHFSL